MRLRRPDRADIKFVSKREDALAPGPEPQSVKNGSLVALGSIPEGEDKVEVEANMFMTPLAAIWLTYVLENGTGDWKVTGTTGPAAIS